MEPAGTIARAVDGVLRIKVTPEDFIVREHVDIPFHQEGRYRIYLLEKRGWNTADAVESVAEASGVPVSVVRYAGLKDRHALTRQYISVPREHELKSRVPDLELTPAGFSDEFVSTKVLVGNTFEITIRRLGPAERAFIELRLPEVQRFGFLNYFDDQRFGSVTAEGDFLAERLLKGHLKGALRLYLTAVYPGQRKAERDRRQAISAAWGHWDAVLALCASGTSAEKEIARILPQGGNRKNLLKAVNAIPGREMAMYFAAYQGFIWNRSLRIFAGLGDDSDAGGHGVPRQDTAGRAVARPGCFSVPGKTGSYVFCRDVPDDVFESLHGAQIPTVARQLLYCPPAVEAAVDAALGERGVALSDFNLRGIRAAYFKSFYRPAIVVPGDLSAGAFLPDELYQRYEKVRLSFLLPRGSYATMLLKALGGLRPASPAGA